MKRSSQLAELLMPWAGLVAGTFAAGFAHQFGSEGVFDHCAPISPIPLIVVVLLCMLLAIAGGIGSLRIARNESEGPARRLIGLVSVGAVALFLLAMVLPIIASLMLPPCFQ